MEFSRNRNRHFTFFKNKDGCLNKFKILKKKYFLHSYACFKENFLMVFSKSASKQCFSKKLQKRLNNEHLFALHYDSTYFLLKWKSAWVLIIIYKYANIYGESAIVKIFFHFSISYFFENNLLRVGLGW